MDATDRLRLVELIEKFYDFEETRVLAVDLGLDFDALRGETKSSKARELVAYVERRGKLDELVKALLTQRPDLQLQFESFKSSPPLPTSDADILKIELSSLRQQLDEIRKDAVTGDQLAARLDETLKTATRAIGRSEELTARVLLPPPELTDVQLLPSGALDRLEEYRSDENVAYLLIGAFGGAILGVLSNWATNENFVITRISLLLLGIFATLCVMSGFWAWRLHRRIASVKQKTLSGASPQIDAG